MILYALNGLYNYSSRTSCHPCVFAVKLSTPFLANLPDGRQGYKVAKFLTRFRCAASG